jgi:hypothetical protein
MGKRTTTGNELAIVPGAGTFTGTGSGAWVADLTGAFHAALSGTFVGTVVLEQSFDGGTTAVPVSADLYGTPISLSAPMGLSLYEEESGVLYRFRCSAWTSGTIAWRLSR